MTRRCVSSVILACSLTTVLTGCMPKMTIEDIKAKMSQRPPELDMLDAFEGRWEFQGEAKMAGFDDVFTTTGTNEAKWDGDGRFLVSRGQFNMGELGEMLGVETWTYDTHDEIFRSTWVDSVGFMGTGTAKHDAKTNTWHMRATSYGPFGKTKYKGKVTFVDENTMEWKLIEYAMGGLMKTMEMSGTSRRQ